MRITMGNDEDEDEMRIRWMNCRLEAVRRLLPFLFLQRALTSEP